MSPLRASLLVAGALLVAAACAPEAHEVAHKPVDPPVGAAEAIPDAPLSGSLRGAKFVLRDARYVADHRAGYAHTDIALAAGRAESPCGEIKPAGSPSVWLRLERSDKVGSQDLRLEPGKPGPWSVHYQVHGDEGWIGSADGAAIVSIRAAGPDGRISGALAVCFADDERSCVSGSFDAEPCPRGIDAPVRGALPPETIPEKYARKLQGAAVAPSASASAAP